MSVVKQLELIMKVFKDHVSENEKAILRKIWKELQ